MTAVTDLTAYILNIGKIKVKQLQIASVAKDAKSCDLKFGMVTTFGIESNIKEY